MNARTWRRLAGYAFLLPYLVLFIAFMVVPLMYGLGLSFTRYELATLHPPAYAGLANYSEAMHDTNFLKGLRVTVLFVVLCVPLTVGLALGLAAGLDALPERQQRACRIGLFAPTMITISVAGILWRWFYDSNFGIFNAYLVGFQNFIVRHVPSTMNWFASHPLQIPWLNSTSWALPSIVLMTIWWTV